MKYLPQPSASSRSACPEKVLCARMSVFFICSVHLEQFSGNPHTIAVRFRLDSGRFYLYPNPRTGRVVFAHTNRGKQRRGFWRCSQEAVGSVRHIGCSFCRVTLLLPKLDYYVFDWLIVFLLRCIWSATPPRSPWRRFR